MMRVCLECTTALMRTAISTSIFRSPSVGPDLRSGAKEKPVDQSTVGQQPVEQEPTSSQGGSSSGSSTLSSYRSAGNITGHFKRCKAAFFSLWKAECLAEIGSAEFVCSANFSDHQVK